MVYMMKNNMYLKMAMLERQLIAEKTEKEQLQANLDYISMMTNVEIPTEEEGENNE